MLVRLLYASRAVGGINEPLVHDILERSRTHNLEHGITGVLCTYEKTGTFLQVLEGGREAVNRLYTNLLRDERHRDVTLLHYGEIQERHFAGWRMGSVDLNKVNLSVILRFSESAELDPFSMAGDAALTLLDELTGGAAIVSRDER
ncbi:MAG: BLUF domain-containing protein [Myxococcota bacterium]|nr:BLUF domain-containing protein [Myxococcota bacterium]